MSSCLDTTAPQGAPLERALKRSPSWPRRRQPSLQGPLLAWAAFAITVAWALFALTSYRAGSREVDEWMDAHLTSMGTLIAAGHFDRFEMPARAHPAGSPLALTSRQHSQQSLSVVVWNAAGGLVSQTGPAPLPTAAPTEGITTLQLGPDKERWRAFTRVDADAHQRQVTVLLSMRERDAHAKEIARATAWPMLWMLPGLLILAAWALNRGLRPLGELSGRVEAMGMQRRAPASPTHSELQPVVDAIERLTARLRTSVVRERELADTLAHELRTPLASLRLQAACLKGELAPSDRTAAVVQIDADATRAAAIIDDLMVLARASRQQTVGAARTLDLATLARTVVADHAVRAHRSGHWLSVVAQNNCPARGHSALLTLALSNLVANALQHTPRGTAIQVEVSEDPPAIHVRDNADAMAHLGPSPTTAGNLGLGHRIVQRVAEFHNGDFVSRPTDARGWKTYTLSLGVLGRAPRQPEVTR